MVNICCVGEMPLAVISQLYYFEYGKLSEIIFNVYDPNGRSEMLIEH